MPDDLWEQIGFAVRAEFSDLPTLVEFTRVVLRLLLAALLGGLLGIERESKGKAAGVRTHMLVSMGAALFVLLATQGGMELTELSRVMQGVIAGIGFLGAGTILKGEDESKVQGLTTAAGIWLTAAIGVAAGLGRESTAVLSTLLALGVMSLVPALVKNVDPLPDDRPENDKKSAAPTHSVQPPGHTDSSSGGAGAQAPHPRRPPSRP